jgi:hypothetical protein
LAVAGADAREGFDHALPGDAAAGVQHGGRGAVRSAGAQRGVRGEAGELFVGRAAGVAQQGVDGALAAEDEDEAAGEPERRLPFALSGGCCP